ncbi:MAG: 2-deoxyribose-5-phosphate aldolase [Desulfitibacter sp. BRH_c19]|nr:MAG: 2-deoxyribose-5-phosphate aldolase [Desulfitibacter sp. BRH_c19]
MKQQNKVLNAKEIAKMIDYPMLKPEMTDEEVIEGCKIANEYSVATVCVRPYDVATCKKILENSEVLISAVIGFPHGNSTTAAKLYEAIKAMEDGAVELDIVMPIGKIRSGDWDYVKEDVRTVTEACHERNVLVKIIFENAYLTNEEIAKCCKLCEELKVDFVKTSTGFAGTGATLEHIKLMRESCGPQVAIKASGGIRTLEQVLELYKAGATRIGTSATQKIMEEVK